MYTHTDTHSLTHLRTCTLFCRIPFCCARTRKYTLVHTVVVVCTKVLRASCASHLHSTRVFRGCFCCCYCYVHPCTCRLCQCGCCNLILMYATNTSYDALTRLCMTQHVSTTHSRTCAALDHSPCLSFCLICNKSLAGFGIVAQLLVRVCVYVCLCVYLCHTTKRKLCYT